MITRGTELLRASSFRCRHVFGPHLKIISPCFFFLVRDARGVFPKSYQSASLAPTLLSERCPHSSASAPPHACCRSAGDTAAPPPCRHAPLLRISPPPLLPTTAFSSSLPVGTLRPFLDAATAPHPRSTPRPFIDAVRFEEAYAAVTPA
jgi:hypothetical protein